MQNNVFTLTVRSTGYQRSVSVNIIEDLKLIVHLRRLDDYNQEGYFGFDWMREDYEEVCQNYEELKKEYNSIDSLSKEYYVPWISMNVNQQNVKLKLKLDIEGTASSKDMIVFDQKFGIEFTPNKINVTEAEGKEIQINCTSILEEYTSIDIKNQHSEIIGRLNFFPNNQSANLNVKIVKVKGNEEDNTYNEKVFTSDVEKWITTDVYKSIKKSLSQSLIHTNIEQMEEMIIDVEHYLQEDFLLVNEDSNGNRQIPQAKREDILEKLYSDYKNKKGEYNGIIVFLTPYLSPPTMAFVKGYSKMLPRNVNYVIMFSDSLEADSIDIVHEIGHVLGLPHTFEDKDIKGIATSRVEKEKSIKQKEIIGKQIAENKGNLKYYAKHSAETKLPNSTLTVKDMRIKINNNLSILDSNLQIIEEAIAKYQNDIDRFELTPNFSFDKSQTENIMDYNGTGEDTVASKYERITFSKYQWENMLEEIKLYHGKK